MNQIQNVLRHLLPHEEPVAYLGAIVGGIDVARQALSAAGVHDWTAAVPVLLALVTRQWVYSPATIQRLKAVASTMKTV